MTDRDPSAHPTERLQSWKKHPLLRAAAAYVVGAWVIVQVCEVVLPVYDVPDRVMQIIINTLIVIFPVVMLILSLTPVARLLLPHSSPVDGEASKDEAVDRPDGDAATETPGLSEAEEILRLHSAELEFPVTLSERRSITTVACAVRGVRDGRDDPELLIGVLPAVAGELQAIVDRYEGTRLGSSRNQIVVAFGYPIVHEDDAKRAAGAALEIIALLYAQDRDDDPGTLIVSQAGLHTDVLIIDESADGADPLSLLGDSTSIAEWLLAFAPDNGVAVSAESADLLGNHYSFEQTQRLSHPRLGQDVPIFRLGAELGGQLQHIVRVEGELLGRGLEHQKLLEHWQTVVDGESQYVLLVGEPGIGKSTLLRHVVHDLVAEHAPGLVVLTCESYDRGSSLRAVIHYFERELFGNDYSLPHPERLARLAEFLRSSDIDTPGALPLLARLLSVESDDPDLKVDESGRLVREKTLALLIDLLHAVAAKQPLLLVIEDLQWADPSTTDLVERLLTQSPERRIFGLFTSRPEFQTDWTHFSHLSIINLGRLPGRIAAEMIQARLGDTRISDTLAERIIAESGGVPLYIDELIRGLRESADALEADAEDSLSVPASLQAALAARVEKLGASKPLLQLCSVIGHEFTYQLLRQVVTSDNRDLLDKILKGLVSEGMLYQKGVFPDVTFKFKHRLIMEAAYRSLIARTRQQLHAAIANTLETSFPELCASFPTRLAQHFDRSGDAGKAVFYRVMAARLAQDQFANDEALLQLKRGFDTLQHIPDEATRNFAELALQNIRGSVLLASRGFTNEEAMQAFERAVELSEHVADSPELFRMVVGMWMYYFIKGNYAQAQTLSERLMSLAEDSGGPPECLQANYCAGYSILYQGALKEAQEYFQRAVDFEKPGEDYTRQSPSRDDTRVHARCLLAVSLWYGGDAPSAMTELERALDLAVKIEQPYARVWSLFQATWFRHSRGESDAMAATAADCVAIGEETGFSFFVPLGLFFQAGRNPDPQERLRSMTEFHEVMLMVGAGAGDSYFRMTIAAELLAQNRFEEAATALEKTREVAAQMNEKLWLGEVLRLEALLALRQDDPASTRAMDLLHESIAFSQSIGNRPFALRSALTLHDCTKGSSKSLDFIREIMDSYGASDSTPEFERAREILSDPQTHETRAFAERGTHDEQRGAAGGSTAD